MSYPTRPSSDDKINSNSTILNLPPLSDSRGVKRHFERIRQVWANVTHPASVTMGLVCVSLIALCGGVFAAYQKDVYKQRATLSGKGGDNGGLFLQGQMQSIDTDAGVINVEWSTGLGCGYVTFLNASFQYDPINDPKWICGQSLVDLNIYTNENASSIYNGTWTTSQWSVASSNMFPLANNIASSAAPQTFTTSLPFDLQTQLNEDKYASVLAYPFDKYTAYITFLISQADNNATLPISSGSVQSAIPNWSIYSTGFQLQNCTEVTLDADFNILCANNVPDPLQRFVVKVTATRTGSTIAFVALIWITNWRKLITLVILWTTMKVVVFGSFLPSELVLVPITALFSLPAVRSVMPGSPDFGSYIDITGFLFDLAIISLCSAAVLVVGIRRQFENPEED